MVLKVSELLWYVKFSWLNLALPYSFESRSDLKPSFCWNFHPFSGRSREVTKLLPSKCNMKEPSRIILSLLVAKPTKHLFWILLVRCLHATHATDRRFKMALCSWHVDHFTKRFHLETHYTYNIRNILKESLHSSVKLFQARKIKQAKEPWVI